MSKLSNLFRGNHLFPLFALAALFLAGCGGGELTYRVTGSSPAEVQWLDADGAVQTETASLPWEKTLDGSSSGTFQVSAQLEAVGNVTCEALFDGEPLGEKVEAQVYASCGGSYEVSGGSRSVNAKTASDVLPSGKSALPPTGIAALADIDAGWQDRLERVEFSRFVHKKDCSASDQNLVIGHFEFDYISDFEVVPCSAGEVTNYANMTGELEGFGEMFVVVGYNNHPIDRDEYAAFARTDIASFPPTFTGIFDEATPRGELDLTAELIYQDFDIFDNTQDGFLRIATIPNFETGEGINLIFISPAFSDDLAEEFDLFDGYTRRMVDSVAFFDEPPPLPTPTPEPTVVPVLSAAERLDILDFDTYSHDIDCSPINEVLQLQQISLDYPVGMTPIDCTENPDAYVAFEQDLSEVGLPEILAIVGRANHPLDVDEYVEAMGGLMPQLGEQSTGSFDGVLRDDTFLEIGERLFLRHDYDIVRGDAPGFTRIVIVPDFETGVGLLFIFYYPALTDDLETEYQVFEGVTNRMIDSARFSGTSQASAPSSQQGEALLASYDVATEPGHFIAFEDSVAADDLDVFLFTAEAGSTIEATISADSSVEFTIYDVFADEIVVIEEGTDLTLNHSFTENSVYQIGVINLAQNAVGYVATFEADLDVSFSLEPNFYVFGSYAPGQVLSYLLTNLDPDTEVVLQALPHPEIGMDLGVEIITFSDEIGLVDQDDAGANRPENVFYTVGQDGEEVPYVVQVEGVDGGGGIFMLTVNIDGEGNLDVR